MPEHICKNCRHWSQVGWAVHMVGKRYGVCELSCVFNGERQHPEAKLMADGYQSTWARLATLDDFGCVQFESREKAV